MLYWTVTSSEGTFGKFPNSVIFPTTLWCQFIPVFLCFEKYHYWSCSFVLEGIFSLSFSAILWQFRSCVLQRRGSLFVRHWYSDMDVLCWPDMLCSCIDAPSCRLLASPPTVEENIRYGVGFNRRCYLNIHKAQEQSVEGVRVARLPRLMTQLPPPWAQTPHHHFSCVCIIIGQSACDVFSLIAPGSWSQPLVMLAGVCDVLRLLWSVMPYVCCSLWCLTFVVVCDASRLL